MDNDVKWTQPSAGLVKAEFKAMASPCELWCEAHDWQTVQAAFSWAQTEVLRIERKFSRFSPESYLSQINAQAGRAQVLDAETSALIELVHQAWLFSQGDFDVTVLPLMQLWKFDTKSSAPSFDQIKQALTFCGWHRVEWRAPQLRLPQGFCLDLGGLVKEYAVDKIALGLKQRLPGRGILVNFGGDLHSPAAPKRPWTVAIEPIDVRQTEKRLEFTQGAMTTSGNTKRFILNEKGERLGHIVHPKTGFPVKNGPSSVTVVAQTATQAGLLSTLAMLKPKPHATRFLKAQKVVYFVS